MFHNGPIAAVAAFGPYIATAGYDNQIILWDAKRRKPLARALHDHLANHCAFSSKGKWLVSSSSDYSVRIWALPDLRLKTCLNGHTDDVNMAVFSPDDQWIASCSFDRTIRIFDLSGHCHTIFSGHTGTIMSVEWRSDSRTVVSCSVDGTVREWDIFTGECTATHIQEGIRTDSFIIASDGVIYAGDDQGRIVIIQDNQMMFHSAHRAGIKKMVYHKISHRLVTLSYDGSMAIWSIEGNHDVRLINRSFCPPMIWMRAADFLDADRIAVGTFGSKYAIYSSITDSWDLDGIVPDCSLNAIRIFQGKQYTIGDAGVVLCHDLTPNQPVANMGSLCNFMVETGYFLLTGGQMGQLYDAFTGKTLYEHHSPLNCGVSFIRHGLPHVAIGTYTGEILIFIQETAVSLKLETMFRPYGSPVKGISASEEQLFSVCGSTDITWHDLDDFHLIRQVKRAHERVVNGCCRAGKNGFASISRDRKLRLWLEDGDAVYDTPHPNSVKCICANTENNILMSGAYTGTVAAFDLQSRSWIHYERISDAGISCLAYDSRSEQFWASSYNGNRYAIEIDVHANTIATPSQCALPEFFLGK